MDTDIAATPDSGETPSDVEIYDVTPLQNIFDDIAAKVFPPMDPYSILVATLGASCKHGYWIDAEWSKEVAGVPIHKMWQSVFAPSDDMIARFHQQGGVLSMVDKEEALVHVAIFFCRTFYEFMPRLRMAIDCANGGDMSAFRKMLSVFLPYRQKNLIVLDHMTAEYVMEEILELEEEYEKLIDSVVTVNGMAILTLMQKVLLLGAACLYYLEG